MVFQFSKWDDVLEDLKERNDYVAIDKATYTLLYKYLYKKFRDFIS